MLRAMQRRFSAVERRLYFAVSDLVQKGSRAKAGKHVGSRSTPEHLITGERGEDEAYFYLRERGYTITARRWRAGTLRGDLDLVAWDGDTLVIFEVKTRTARDFAAAEAEVDRDKQRMLRRMAAAYIRQFPERHRERLPVRFDVISVYLLKTGLEVEHFRAAFSRNEGHW